MYIIKKHYEEINIQKWNEFLNAHTEANIFYTPEMVELYNLTRKHTPVVISCFNKGGDLVGLIVAVIQKEYKGFFGKITARAIVWGGPLVVERKKPLMNLILEEFDKVCAENAIYTQFRNTQDIFEVKDIFLSNGYFYEDHADILFDLTQGSDLLWSKIDPTRKKQINRSIKRGVKPQIVEELEENDLNKCFSILENVYQKAKLPYPDREYFLNSLNVLGKHNYFKAALAFYENEIIGFRFFLCYKGLIYDWYAGSLIEYHDKYPNDILPWAIIKWGSENGYLIFDFGGAGNPDKPYGVRDYKKKFGGEMVNYGRFQKDHKKILFKLAKAGFRLWRLIKF